MAHGLNNMYEGGANLYSGRHDSEGLVKKGYKRAAKALGLNEEDGTTAYLTADVALSGAGMSRLVLKRDAWRLFRYMRSDKERAVRQMGGGALLLEILNNANTLYQIKYGRGDDGN